VNFDRQLIDNFSDARRVYAARIRAKRRRRHQRILKGLEMIERDGINSAYRYAYT
jgi:hypothetical protein